MGNRTFDGRMKQKMMWGIMLVLAALLLAPLSARADVVPGPDETNEFFYRHREDIDSDFYEHCYTKARTNGYEAPGDKRASVTVKSGEDLFVLAVYRDEDGSWWGFSEDGRGSYSHGSGPTGSWFMLEDLYLYYDGSFFEDDYGDEIYRDERIVFDDTDTLAIYSYPCAKEAAYVIQLPASEEYATRRFFRDDEGRIWGRIKYGRYANPSVGVLDEAWVLTDDPEDENAGDDRYAREISALTLVEEAGSGRQGRTGGAGRAESGMPRWVLIVSVVALSVIWVIAVAAVVLLVRKHRKDRGMQ